MHKKRTKSNGVGRTPKENTVADDKEWRALWWKWYKSLTVQQLAEHYWYQDLMSGKVPWKGKARIYHYSDEMKAYPHIQEIIADREAMQAKAALRKKE